MATERIIIVIEERGTRRVKREIVEVGQSAERSAGSLGLLKKALLAVGSVQTLRLALGTLADFEQQLSTVRGITGATEAQFKALRDTAADLGATTRFAASEAAEGMVFLARAGFTVEEQLESIDDTLLLAQAGALDLASAADIASNVLRGFRLEAREATRAVDVLALAANSSNTNVLQLGDALKFVAPIASGLGVSLEETTAAAGALSDAGLQASLAGTGLRRVLSELESPASKTRGILESLGLSTDDVRVSQVGLTTALRRLRDAGLDTGQALEVFGDRGGPAFEVLSQAIPRLEEFTSQLQNAEGTAQGLAAVMDDNLNGAILAAKSALEALVLALGESGAASAAESIFRGLASTFRFLANNIEIVNGALITFSILAIPRAIKSLALLKAALISTGVGAIVVLLGTAVGALVAFSDELKVSADGLTTLADVGTAVLQEFGFLFGELFASVRDTFGPLLQEFGAAIGIMEFDLRGFLRFAAQTADNFVGIFVGSFEALKVIFNNFPRAVNAAIVVSINGIIGNIEFLVDAVRASFNTLVTQFKNVSSRLELAFINLNEARRQLLAGNTEDAAKFFGEARFQLEQGAKGFVSGVGDTFIDEFDKLRQSDTLPRIGGNLAIEAEEIGKEITQAFADGLNSTTGVEDLLDRAFVNADLRAQGRDAQRQLDALGAGGSEPAAQQTGLQRATELFNEFLRAAARRQDVFARLNADLDAQARLLQLSNREQSIANDLADVEASLAEQNIVLAQGERELLEERVRNLQSLREQADLLEEIRGPQEQLAIRQEALTELFRSGRISAEEYADGLRSIERAAAETDRTLSGGFERGLLRVEETIRNFSDQAETTVVNAFGNAENALIDFRKTGEFEFHALTESILDDLQRLLQRQALFALINAFGGDGAGAGAGAGGLAGLLSGRQIGGPVETGDVRLVGENGPELDIARRPGNIVPAGPTSQILSGQAQVRVTVVNVVDPREIVSAGLEGAEGDEIIVNKIGRNRRRVSAELGTGG